MPEQTIVIQVCYALPQRQELVTLKMAQGSTLADAVERSGLLEKYPEINLASNKLGIFARLSKPDTVLRDRDRVEIYRSLLADPKEIRKKRAADGKPTRRGGG